LHETEVVEFPLPSSFTSRATLPDRAEWITSLPRVVGALKDHWSLDVGEPFQPGGETAWVAPASSPQFGEVVLKVLWRHDEALDEAKGLRQWSGDGAVRLIDSRDVDDKTTALLLERCFPGTLLSEEPEVRQDVVVAGILRRLWMPPPFSESFRPLQFMCNKWADECEQKLSERPGTVDRGIMREGIAIFRSLPTTAKRNVLLCTDLHAGNILAAEREPWLAIDPKPYLGDPTYDALQHLLNCEARLVANPSGLVARMADLCGLDQERLATWLFARSVIESPHWPVMAEVARLMAPDIFP
jgi:streptomycin 6-kinase